MSSSIAFDNRYRLWRYCDTGCVLWNVTDELGFLLCCFGDYGLEGGRRGRCRRSRLG